MDRLFILSLCAALIGAGPSFANGPKPFPDFEAKRVKPPTAAVGNRINIQIEPQVEAVTPTVAGPQSPAVAGRAEGSYDWFWSEVSAQSRDAGPGRLEKAMLTLASAPNRIAVPRLQHMQDIARANGIDILRATIGTEVSPALVLAVITVESAGRADATSSAGAQGLMQLMPDTAARFGVTDSFVAPQNIAGGVKYLDWLMQEFGQDPILVLAGYNAGEGSVRQHGGVPPFAETRGYVPKVLAAFQVARGLCLTPPELISDGCVFAGMN